MGKTALLTTILGFLCLTLSAQPNKYFGVRAQFGGVLPQTSAAISIEGGMSGGIGLVYLQTLNKDWDMAIDGTFSVFSLLSNERDFDNVTQIFTALGERKINFMSPELTLMLHKSYGAKSRFKAGFGGFLSKNIHKTDVIEQANYWGNSATIDDNYALNNNFLTGINYGLSVESGFNFNAFQVLLRYKQGFANINTEGSPWRQNYVQLGVNYFFGMAKNEGFKHQLDDIQPYNF
jgi:hypothetical protein